MNAKDRLRAYLEQRRDLGESEMLLDALDVDDVMRMLGALPNGSPQSPERAPAVPTIPTASATPPAPPVATPRADGAIAHASDGAEGRSEDDASPPSPVVEQGDDWRQMMQQLQGSAPAKPPTPAVPAVTSDIGAPPPDRKPGVLRIDGVVFPIGLRVELPAARGGAPGAEWQSLQQVVDAIRACTACGLAETATQAVPGVGDPAADVMVVGEAPGENEDLRGEPFVGPAGALLDKILGAIQLNRETVYICNVLKHRPPGNRNPMPDEVRACSPFLQRQIDLVQPKLILAFGTFAAQSLLGTKLGIGKLRQQLHWYQGIPLVATYHPAALLRNEAWKRPTWEDVKLARRVLDATVRS